jgi:nicotinamide riboside transporter PnuC
VIDWTWGVTALSVVGTVLNIKKKPVCFLIWLVTNIVWCAYDFIVGCYAQSGLFLVYIGLAVWGIYEWRFKKKSNG